MDCALQAVVCIRSFCNNRIKGCVKKTSRAASEAISKQIAFVCKYSKRFVTFWELSATCALPKLHPRQLFMPKPGEASGSSHCRWLLAWAWDSRGARGTSRSDFTKSFPRVRKSFFSVVNKPSSREPESSPDLEDLPLLSVSVAILI